MFYLIYITETCRPGRMYGPATFEICQAKLVQFVKDDEKIDIAPDSEEYITDEETGAGWYIIQNQNF